MAEIDKKRIEEIKEFVGRAANSEVLTKEVSIIKDARGQFTIRIPKRFAELSAIDHTKDIFQFKLIPDGEPPTVTYRITAELKRGH